MHQHIKSVADIYAFNTLSVRACLQGLANDDAGRRWRQGEGSSILFLVGHILSSRVGLLRRFGAAEENPYAELFGAGAETRDPADYPTIEELARGWDDVAARFESTLESLTEEQILAPAEGLPVPDRTGRGALMFLSWHESYHVGQLGLMLTEMGYKSLQARVHEALGD
ncbi:MAG: DinB family protein [Acidobacteriota bacterium]